MFWCVSCEKFTEPEFEGSTVRCTRCGDFYRCSECGFEIDRTGECQRSAAGAGECLGKVESR